MKNKIEKRRGSRIIVAAVLLAVLCCSMILSGCSDCKGCATWQRSCKTWQSEVSGGLDRTVNVYAYDGTLIATYTGRIDIEQNDTKVLFDLDGKRYIYYNAIVEVIEN